MIAHPAPDEILQAAVRYLKDQLLPQLDGAAAFNLRVSVNAIDLVRREILYGAAAAQQEQARLRSLLASDEPLSDEPLSDEPLEVLRDRFCDRIAQGTLTPADPAVRDHLRATAVARLAIDQPSYSAYRAAVASQRASSANAQ